jgi:hypothetical protein
MMTTTTPGSYGETSRPGAVAARRSVRRFTETKLGVKTSEFWMMLIFAIAVIVAAYAKAADALSRDDGWRYASFVAVAYIISRGFAKAGVREPYTDDDRDY